MRRYEGDPLPIGCRVAIVSNDALGNYLMATPLIQMLRRNLCPTSLHYFGGTRTEELWQIDPGVDWGYSLFGNSPAEAVAAASGNEYDLVVNTENHPWASSFTAIIAEGGFVVGPCLGPDGRKPLAQADDEFGLLASDEHWIADDLSVRYPFLRSGHISEIWCRLCYLAGEIPAYRVASSPPKLPVPDVLLSTSASLDSKLWPTENWLAIGRWLKGKGLSLGVLGAAPTAQSRFWKGGHAEQALIESDLAIDLRGALTLPEVSGAIGLTRLVLTIDNGILHMAAATSTPTVGLFRHGIHRLWAPPVESIHPIVAHPQGTVADIAVTTVQRTIESLL